MSRVKSAPKRLRRPVKRKKKRGPIVSLRKMLWILFLGSFLLFSLGSLGYVIFFRTVHAAEVKIPDKKVIVFEEPDPPVQDKTEIETSGSLAASPRIAIIIDDMGYHREVGEELINLPLDITYSFLPGAPFTELLEDHAHQKGRTVLLHLPLEPRDRKWNPGPGALYLGEMDRQREKIEENLTHVPHAIGINNHMGSLYSEDELHMAALIHIIKEKNLFYVDSFTTAESVGMRLAQEIEVKTARRHVFLDNVQTKERICGQLEKLAILAEEKGEAIGIGHPYPQTLAALVECKESYTSSVTLVGAQELVK